MNRRTGRRTGRGTAVCSADCDVKRHAHCGARSCCSHLYDEAGALVGGANAGQTRKDRR